MRVIELFGLPGSGKTYQTIRLYNYLSELGYKCVLIRSNEYSNLPYINRKKYILNIFKLKNITIFLSFIIKNLLYSGKKFYLGNFKERLKILLRQIMYIEIYNDDSLLNDYDFIISDQGIIQECAGYFLENWDAIEQTSFLLKQIKNKKNIYFYYNHETLLSSYKNIKKRKRRSAAMDYYSDDSLKDYLEQYDLVLNKIFEKNKEGVIFLNDFNDLKNYL